MSGFSEGGMRGVYILNEEGTFCYLHSRKCAALFSPFYFYFLNTAYLYCTANDQLFKKLFTNLNNLFSFYHISQIEGLLLYYTVAKPLYFLVQRMSDASHIIYHYQLFMINC